MAEGKACRSWGQKVSTPFGLTAVLFVLYAIELACPKGTLATPSSGPSASDVVYNGLWMSICALLIYFAIRAFFARGFRMRLLWQAGFGIALLSALMHWDNSSALREGGDELEMWARLAIFPLQLVLQAFIGGGCRRIASEKANAAAEVSPRKEAIALRIVMVLFSVFVGCVLFFATSQGLFAARTEQGMALDAIKYYGWPLPFWARSPAFSIAYARGAIKYWRAYVDLVFWVNVAYCGIRIPWTIDWIQAHLRWFSDNARKIFAIAVPIVLILCIWPEYTILNKHWGYPGTIQYRIDFCWWKYLLSFF